MAKYDKNALTPRYQRLATAYIKQLINDPDTCEVFREQLIKRLQLNKGTTDRSRRKHGIK